MTQAFCFSLVKSADLNRDFWKKNLTCLGSMKAMIPSETHVI